MHGVNERIGVGEYENAIRTYRQIIIDTSTITYAVYLVYSGQLVQRLGSLRLVGLATQNAVRIGDLGVATSTVNFFRSVGGARLRPGALCSRWARPPPRLQSSWPTI